MAKIPDGPKCRIFLKGNTSLTIHMSVAKASYINLNHEYLMSKNYSRFELEHHVTEMYEDDLVKYYTVRVDNLPIVETQNLTTWYINRLHISRKEGQITECMGNVCLCKSHIKNNQLMRSTFAQYIIPVSDSNRCSDLSLKYLDSASSSGISSDSESDSKLNVTSKFFIESPDSESDSKVNVNPDFLAKLKAMNIMDKLSSERMKRLSIASSGFLSDDEKNDSFKNCLENGKFINDLEIAVKAIVDFNGCE